MRFLFCFLLALVWTGGLAQNIPGNNSAEQLTQTSGILNRLPSVEASILEATEEELANVPEDSLPAWTSNGNATLNFQQVGLENWQGGGESSISIGSKFGFQLTRLGRKSIWESRVRSDFGFVRFQDRGWRKTVDELNLNTNYSLRLRQHIFASALLDFRSQLVPGYRYNEDSLGNEVRGEAISDFLAPGYLNLALGLSYKQAKFSATLAPLAGKVTIVRIQRLADEGRFGVEDSSRVRAQVGASFNAIATYEELVKNVDFISSLLLFSDYERPENIDINWEASFVFKVNKYIQSSLSAQLIYDDEVDVKDNNGDGENDAPAIQFANLVTVGLQYTF